MRTLLLFSFLLFFAQQIFAQDGNVLIRDSLAVVGYDELNENIHRYVNNNSQAAIYARALLRKASLEGNNFQKVLAYKALMHSTPDNSRLKYVDSILIAARKTGNNGIIGGAYLTVGAAYYNNKEEIKALDNYILADGFISRTEDDYLKYKVKYSIASTKYYLGFYEEAISLYSECIDYFKQENDAAYLKSLHALALSYNHVGKFDWSSKYSKIGLEASHYLQIGEMVPHFMSADGITQYHKANYKGSMMLLKKSLPFFEHNNDVPSSTVTHLYLGKCFWKTRNQEKAIEYFKQVDRIISEQEYVHPDVRENYELLIKYYKANGPLETELHYVNRLLAMDSILNRDYKYLSGKIHKEYDTSQLVREKHEIETAVKGNKIIFAVIITVLVVAMASLFYSRSRTRKRYRQKYEEFIKGQEVQNPIQLNAARDKELNINPDVVKKIIRNIEKFELKKKYLEKDLGTVKVAEMLNTNTKYLSKIIFHYRGKNFIQYLNDLRIAHIVELLQTQSKYRNYTNKALGEEAGFGSTQIFTQVFKAKLGMSPTFFIRQLNKED